MPVRFSEQASGTTRTVLKEVDSAGSVVSRVRRSVLPNGLRIITEAMPGVRSASIGVWVGTGSEGATEQRTFPVDTVVVCAGQESVRTVADVLEERGLTVHVVGGADVAAELDAKRAIRQGTEVASRI